MRIDPQESGSLIEVEEELKKMEEAIAILSELRIKHESEAETIEEEPEYIFAIPVKGGGRIVFGEDFITLEG